MPANGKSSPDPILVPQEAIEIMKHAIYATTKSALHALASMGRNAKVKNSGVDDGADQED